MIHYTLIDTSEQLMSQCHRIVPPHWAFLPAMCYKRIVHVQWRYLSSAIFFSNFHQPNHIFLIPLLPLVGKIEFPPQSRHRLRNLWLGRLSKSLRSLISSAGVGQNNKNGYKMSAFPGRYYDVAGSICREPINRMLLLCSPFRLFFFKSTFF